MARVLDYMSVSLHAEWGKQDRSEECGRAGWNGMTGSGAERKNNRPDKTFKSQNMTGFLIISALRISDSQ